jgi:pimeloyl-ACP methyl ester carboxylesterase
VLATRRSGQGQPVVLVHGGLTHGDLAWGEQRILEERWTLVVPDRVGYGDSADLGDGEDFDRDAELIADDLDQGSHLVGYSSGSMAAMLAAARRPEAVASLTVIEPPAFHLAPGSAAASELLKANQRLWDSPGDDPVGVPKGLLCAQQDPTAPRRSAPRPFGANAGVAALRATTMGG